jgi:hypothetical protein
MNTHTRSLLAVFMMTSLALSPLAEAKRMGSGKSSGMSRSSKTYSGTSTPQRSTYRPSPVPVQPTQRNRGIGMGTVAGAAVAAGAAGYMLGHANTAQAAPTVATENPISNSPTPAPVDNGISWFWLILLAGLGYFIYRRFAAKKAAAAAYAPYRTPQQPFVPTPNPSDSMGGFAPASPFLGTDTLPDGMTKAAFLRMARANFLHLQTMNNSSHIEELRRYFTPEMYQQVRDEVMNNHDTAEFPQLNAQVIDSSTEGTQHIASVRFSGMVSESLDAPAVPFNETWHFVKDLQGTDWLVAGIQQNA